jgi:hypothetical protein
MKKKKVWGVVWEIEEDSVDPEDIRIKPWREWSHDIECPATIASTGGEVSADAIPEVRAWFDHQWARALYGTAPVPSWFAHQKRHRALRQAHQRFVERQGR